MSNDQLPAKFKSGGAAAHRTALIEKMRQRKQAGEAPQPVAVGGVYMKFNGNDGRYTVGKPPKEVKQGVEVAVNIAQAQHGWLEWKGGEVVNRRMIPVVDGPSPAPPEGEPLVGELKKPYDRDGWQDTMILQVVGLSGDLKGVTVEFTTSSYGGKQAVNGVLDVAFEMIDTPEGARGFINPIVTLGGDSYYHDGYSRDVHFPVLEIVGWTDGETRIAPPDGPDLLAAPTTPDPEDELARELWGD